MEIALLLILIVLNGVFAMSELALVAARKARLSPRAQAGDNGAAAAIDLKREPTRFLSTVQIGITSISILNGIVGEAALAGPFAVWLTNATGLDAATAQVVATALVVIAITYTSIVVGELVPKRIAQVAPEKIAGIVARPMRILAMLAAPFVWLLSASTEFALRLLRIRDKSGPPITEEEIVAMVAEGSDAGVIERSEHDMVRNVFKLDDRRVGTFMTPRSEMTVLDATLPLETNMARAVDSQRSRFPVIDGNPDNVIGIVQTKDLVRELIDKKGPGLFAQLQAPLFVPESLTGRELLDNLRSAHKSAALVVDEYGDLQGIVTLNDLMYAIAGDLERPPQDQAALHRDDGSWLLDGMISTLELQDLLDLDELPDNSRSYDSLGGMLMTLLGRLPVTGDKTNWDKWTFEVVDMDGRRVDKVLASHSAPQAPDQSEPD